MKIAITSDMFYPTLNGVSVFSRNLATGLARRGHQVIVIAPSQTGVAYEEIDNGETVRPISGDAKTPKNHYRIYRLKAKPFPFYRNQTDAHMVETVETLTDQATEQARWREVLSGLKDYLPKVYEKGFMVSVAPAKEMIEILDNFSPDVIHNQQELMIGNYIATYAHKKGIPVMTTNHIMPDNLFNNLKMPKLVEKTMIGAGNTMTRSFLERFDFVTMPTKLAIDGLFDASHPAKIPMKAISNGIDLKLFHPGKPDKALLSKYGFSTRDKIVTFVGRFDKEKHIPILMEAFKNLKTPAKLLLIGDGDELYDLQDLAKEMGIADRTVFIGRVSRQELAALHRLSTVFVMPSPAELQSIATLEAMASGKPIVVVDMGALPELVDGNGFVVETDNIQAMSKRIDKILSDNELRSELGAKSQKIAKTHEIGKTIDQFEAIYQDLHKKRAKKGVAYVAIGSVGLALGGLAMAAGNVVNKAKAVRKKK